jgi:flagellar hook-associated protein 2
VSTLSFPGLATGIDTTALINQLVAAESSQLNLLKSRQSVLQTKSSAYDTLETRLKTLQDAADELRDAGDLRAYKLTTSDSETLSATASSGASEGFHEVAINRLASAERDVHAGLASEDTLVGVGTFSYTYGTGEDAVTRTIQTTEDTTLEGLRDLINNDSGNPGVTASVLEHDAGGGNVFHLVLSGNDSGSDYSLEINDAETTLDGTDGKADFTAASFTETQQAQDCQLQVDGYPSTGWIERSSNTVDDVLPGVSLDLHATGTVTLSLSRETDELEEKLQDMVDAYNSVVDYVQQSTDYDEDTKVAGPLIGDYTLTHIRRELRLAFVEALPGFSDGSDAYSLAGELGLKIDSEGHMELDTDVLDEAISDNYLGVLAAIGARRTGASEDDYLKFLGCTVDTEPGTYDVKATFDGAGDLVSARIKLASEGESAWRDAEVDGNVIIGAEGHDEQYLRITATWDGASTTQEAEVRVREGLAGKLYEAIDEMLDSSDGAVTIARDQCDSSLDVIKDNISRQEDRLDAYAERLKLKFARLEQALTMLEGQRAALGLS